VLLYLQRHCEPREGDLNSRQLGLSEEGTSHAEKTASWLARSVQVDAVVASPFARCEETAAIDASAFNLPYEASELVASQDPGGVDCQKIWGMLRSKGEAVLLVSHQEVNTPLLKWFRGQSPRFEWGSVACVDVDEGAEHPVGHLQWFITLDEPALRQDPAISAFSQAVDLAIKDFVLSLSVEVEEISSAVVAHLTAKVRTDSGRVVQGPANASSIMAAESVFVDALNSSQAYPLVTALVSSLPELAMKYSDLHEESIRSVDLEEDDRDLLAGHAASVVAAVEGEFGGIVLDFRKQLGRYLGDGHSLDQIVSGAITYVNRMNRVEPVVADQVLTWLRLFGSVWFSRVEERTKLRYAYAGPRADRDFCRKLLKQPPVTREEVRELDNGQLPDVLANAGGYGCKHFWVAEVAA
jgi:phosphohistidine phosphatase SixA